MVTDLEVIKGTFAHKIDASQTVGAEVVKSLAKETTTFTVGYSKKAEGGALYKARLNNSGAQEFHPLSLPPPPPGRPGTSDARAGLCEVIGELSKQLVSAPGEPIKLQVKRALCEALRLTSAEGGAVRCGYHLVPVPDRSRSTAPHARNLCSLWLQASRHCCTRQS